MWLPLILISIASLSNLGDAYLYCDPFQQAKMLRCVCSLLDYKDVHNFADVQNEPLLCQRYADYKECTSAISPICRKTVVGHLDNVYEVICNSKYKEPCTFTFTVDLDWCPIKPLCEGTACYINHGSKASITPEACNNQGIIITTPDHPAGDHVNLVETVELTCNDGVLSAVAFSLTEPYSRISSIGCAPPPPGPTPAP